MNWEVLQIKSESDIALWYMSKKLWDLEWLDDPTKLYANTLINSIVDLESKDDKSSRDFEVLLKYLKELEWVISIKSKVWYRYTPVDDVEFIDDL